MNKPNFKITLHSSVSTNPFFTRLNAIEIDKPTIFKYGILNEDPPAFICENDFEYLQSKVPNWLGCYGDNIKIDKNRIISYAVGENSIRISEIIGVGVGLTYAIELLEINPNLIRKIPKPDKKIKYMDFAVNKDGRRYEIEAKGTVIRTNSKKNQLLKDIQEKKKASSKTACKFGVITMANKEKEMKDTEIIICDDYNDISNNSKESILSFVMYYKLFLSFILDSTYYNRMIDSIKEGNIHNDLININKIKGRYEYKGITYCGEYFDKRLIMDKIRTNYKENMTAQKLFKKLTRKVGIAKYFIGIDNNIINAINRLDIEELSNYKIDKEVIEKVNHSIIKDSDGLIIITSINNSDDQISRGFTEKDVEKRLGSMVNYHIGKPHKCGAPCRSQDKEGDPCEILTYRDNCHFHR